MRYLILSDIHANLSALEAVLSDVGPVDAAWCLGDIVGYGPQPNECIERVRTLPNLRCVAGNHDWAALGKISLADFNTEARLAAEWTARQLTAENRVWLDSLPERVEAEGFTLVHGSPRYPIWEYILSATVAYENMAYFSTLICLVGHSHVPVIFRERSRQQRAAEIVEPLYGRPWSYRAVRAIINPGSVGQPRDGDPEACCLLLDPGAATVTYRRVPYPIAETQQRIRAAGLPARLAERLEYGM